jgi:hypothetical protein
MNTTEKISNDQTVYLVDRDSGEITSSTLQDYATTWGSELCTTPGGVVDRYAVQESDDADDPGWVIVDRARREPIIRNVFLRREDAEASLLELREEYADSNGSAPLCFYHADEAEAFAAEIRNDG